MSETCARCGHTTGTCPHCGITRTGTLGGRINGKTYCHTHNLQRPTCYEATLREIGQTLSQIPTLPAWAVTPDTEVMSENDRSQPAMHIHLEAGRAYTLTIHLTPAGAPVPDPGVTMDGGQPIVPTPERPTEPAMPPAEQTTCKCPMHGRPPRVDPHGTHELEG